MSLLNPNLQAFLAVHQQKTVMAAARQLHLTQTAVTQRIRSLERELKVSLFKRSRTGMVLTSEGESLLKYCLPTLELESKLRLELNARGKLVDVNLTFAGPTSFVSGRVIPQCQILYKKWPQLNLHFSINDAENRVELLKRGDADIVTLYPHQVPREFASKRVQPDRYCLLAHPDWQSRSLTEILRQERLFAFHEHDYTSLNYLKRFKLLKELKRPRLFANENASLSQLLVSGAGFGILEEKIAAPFLKSKQLVLLNDGRVMEDHLALAWYPRSEMPAYFQDVLDRIQ